jgi:type IV pilus assembly protein PilC
MVEIGERSGALESLLMKLADFYEDQVSATVEALTSVIEPVMVAVMGVLVGGIVLAIFMPILKLQQALTEQAG